MHTWKSAQKLVVIARDIDNTGALSGLPEQLLNNIIAILGPIPASFQPPAIHNVTNQNNRFGFMVAQEIDEKFRFRSFRSQVHIGYEKRFEPPHIRHLQHHPCRLKLSFGWIIRLMSQSNDNRALICFLFVF
tara:strand:- start:3225 stop:3620 length:396 start_codon:yes stop_codon:yes gene_type:complete